MDSSKYREVLIGLDRALFVFHEAGDSVTEEDRSLETAIASIRRDVLRTWSGHTPPMAELTAGIGSSADAPRVSLD